MALNTNPIFAKDAIYEVVNVTAANAASDGSGTIVDLVTAGSDGAVITKVGAAISQATRAASSAMVVDIYVKESGGTYRRRYGLQLINVTTTTSALPSAAEWVIPGGLYLSPGAILGVTKSVHAGAQDNLDVYCEGRNLTA